MRQTAPVLLWLRVGGFLIWGAVGCYTLLSEQEVNVTFLSRHRWPWLAGLIVFGLAFWENTREEGKRRLPALVLMGLQSALALGILFAGRSQATPFLLVVVAGQLAILETRRVSWLFLTVQTAGLVLALQRDDKPLKTVLLVSFCLAFQAFVDGLCRDVLAGIKARRKLQETHAELRETRDLLAQSSRLAERLRISRELHDLLGHHLTALNLQLELLSHLTEGRVLHHVGQAQIMAKRLLADVRSAVSAMREESGLSLDASLAAVVEGIHRPRIHLDVPAGLGLEDPDRAHALLRAVQEIVTNAVRHAEAANLWIEVVRAGEIVEIRARDDGIGTADPRFGNGLKGLSQRLAELEGTLEIASALGEGFRVTVRLPISPGALGDP